MSSPAKDKIVQNYTVHAISEEYVSPEADELTREVFKPWSDAGQGDVVGFRRGLRRQERDLYLQPDFGILTRHGDQCLETSYFDYERETRQKLGDALIMSSFGATSVFHHSVIERLCQNTLPKTYDFTQIYLAGAMIFMAEIPANYYEDHVRHIPNLQLRAAATAAYGTIVVPPAEGGHARARQWSEILDAYDFYLAYVGRIGLETDMGLLVPAKPAEITVPWFE